MQIPFNCVGRQLEDYSLSGNAYFLLINSELKFSWNIEATGILSYFT